MVKGPLWNRIIEAVLESAHNLCVRAELRNIMYINVKPGFTEIQVGFGGKRTEFKLIAICLRTHYGQGSESRSL